MNAHSEKGLKTIDLMGTKPVDWHLTPIRWEYRELMMPTKIKCPDCHGYGRTYVNQKSGKPSKDATFENINDRSEPGWKTENPYTICPTCKSLKGDRGSGVITVQKLQNVLVGIPVWAKDTIFDSRFEDERWNRANCQVCALCSKTIKGVWSRLVPVQAKAADGRIHGMWIGEDCARKILGIEVALTEYQKLQLKKSIYKHWIIEGGNLTRSQESGLKTN